jgi:hypothetical protein
MIISGSKVLSDGGLQLAKREQLVCLDLHRVNKMELSCKAIILCQTILVEPTLSLIAGSKW